MHKKIAIDVVLHILRFLVIADMSFLLIWLLVTEVHAAAADPTVEPVKMRVTCYCDQGITYSGVPVREGIIAGKKEWLGAAVYLYEVNDDGSMGLMVPEIFQVLDTGFGMDKDGDGVGTIQEGKSIDLYMPTIEDAREFVGTYGDYMYVYVVKGKG